MNAYRSVFSVLTVGLCAALAACSSVDVPADNGMGAVGSPIVGGSPDTTHSAVVALLMEGAQGTAGACTGTIVKKDGSVGYVLTAAHCVNTLKPYAVVEANDYAAPSAFVYKVLDYKFHPDYSATTDPEDVAVVRILGVTADTPTIPVTAASDGLAPGTPHHARRVRKNGTRERAGAEHRAAVRESPSRER